MASGGKSPDQRGQQEDDLQRPRSVRNLIVGAGVLGAIVVICWYGTRGSSGVSNDGFIACSRADCPAARALPWQSQNAGGVNANPKEIAQLPGKHATPGSGLPPFLSVLLKPSAASAGSPAGQQPGSTPAPVPDSTATTPGALPTTPAAPLPTTPAAPLPTTPDTTPPTTAPAATDATPTT